MTPAPEAVPAPGGPGEGKAPRVWPAVTCWLLAGLAALAAFCYSVVAGGIVTTVLHWCLIAAGVVYVISMCVNTVRKPRREASLVADFAGSQWADERQALLQLKAEVAAGRAMLILAMFLLWAALLAGVAGVEVVGVSDWARLGVGLPAVFLLTHVAASRAAAHYLCARG